MTRIPKGITGLLGALLAAAACSAPPPATDLADATPTPTATVAPAGSCHARGSGLETLPDAACTPGGTNADVTQATIAVTICRRGWTATVRPPESYTEPLKRELMAAYGDVGPMSRWELDHLVPLELGGAPSDPRNLWPEPGASPNPKDRVESAANRAVCTGRMQLADAQRAMAGDWVSFGRQLAVAV